MFNQIFINFLFFIPLSVFRIFQFEAECFLQLLLIETDFSLKGLTKKLAYWVKSAIATFNFFDPSDHLSQVVRREKFYHVKIPSNHLSQMVRCGSHPLHAQPRSLRSPRYGHSAGTSRRTLGANKPETVVVVPVPWAAVDPLRRTEALPVVVPAPAA